MESILTVIAAAVVVIAAVEIIAFCASRIDRHNFKKVDKSILIMEESNINLQKELGRSRDMCSEISKNLEFYKTMYLESSMKEKRLDKIIGELFKLNEYYKGVVELSSYGGQDAFEIKTQRDGFIKAVGSILKVAEEAGVELNKIRLDAVEEK